MERLLSSSLALILPDIQMVEGPTQPPEFKVRPGNALWLTSLTRATESAKHDWRAIHCLVNQRRDGIAPIVLETIKGECLRPPVKYECAFELCLRHLHGRHTPLDVACTVGALLANRAAHALQLPGRWIPTPDGIVDYATHNVCSDEAFVATTADDEQSSTDEDASNSMDGACNHVPSELLATHESTAGNIASCVAPQHEDENANNSMDDAGNHVPSELATPDDSSASSIAPQQEDEDREKEEGQHNCAEDCEEDLQAMELQISPDSAQLTHEEEPSYIEETPTALANAEVSEQRKSHRRKRPSRHWRQNWWNDDAWHYGNEQSRSLQWSGPAWRPKE